MNLIELGWSHFFQQQLSAHELALTPARVCRQDVTQFHLLSERGQLFGLLPGRLRQEARSKADLPTVGDWVVVSDIEGAETHTVQIDRLLERKSKFSRKEAGDVHDEQIVAANIDTVFVVSSLDNDFSPGRIERYLLLCWNSGALPVIILNKADLAGNADRKVAALVQIAQGTPIHVLSAITGDGLDEIRGYMKPGSTCTFIGSSGVGKSTIINTLIGYEKFDTGAVRELDSKGRHTTTFRELVVVPHAGMIIDTPGMREIQLWADSTSLAKSFVDIEQLAAQCRFNDCRHQSEPGCAVLGAIESGDLDPDRLMRYFKLAREIEHFDIMQDAATRAEKKQERKRFSKLLRKRPDKRD